jgi:DNA-binding GntR family transcriptional regulator
MSKRDKRLEAYNRIKQFILTYQIKPTQRLEHEYLKERIGVSTTPIREALNRLMEEGYIFQIKNRGYFVSDLGSKELEDLYEVREALELFAVRKTLREDKRISRASRKKIQKTMDLYFKYAHEEPYRNRLPLDRRFHVDLAKLSGNVILNNNLNSIFEKMNYKRKVVELYPQRGEEASKEHYAIFNLLLEGHEDKLVECLQNHIRKGKKRLLQILKAREEYVKD